MFIKHALRLASRFPNRHSATLHFWLGIPTIERCLWENNALSEHGGGWGCWGCFNRVEMYTPIFLDVGKLNDRNRLNQITCLLFVAIMSVRSPAIWSQKHNTCLQWQKICKHFRTQWCHSHSHAFLLEEFKIYSQHFNLPTHTHTISRDSQPLEVFHQPPNTITITTSLSYYLPSSAHHRRPCPCPPGFLYINEGGKTAFDKHMSQEGNLSMGKFVRSKKGDIILPTKLERS